jgi:hypothetical protein
MANYDSNYAIAQEISARIGVSPIPFDSVYSIALEIYNELGGEPTQFDSVYSILLGILPLVEGGIASKVIDDSVITTVKTWSSSKINSEIEAHSGATYTAGQNISIDSANTISADGYVWNASTGGFAEKYKQDAGEGGQVLANTANALGAHAEGYGTTASGDYGSHAEGNVSVASGYVSHAEGNRTISSGIASHTEGVHTTASSKGAHAEGAETNATGTQSHAEGGFTTAQGLNSHAEGEGTIATNLAEHSEGNYNISHTANNTYGNAGNTQHSVGIGSPSTHKNAFEIMQNGDAYLYGVGGYQGTDTKVQDATIKTLQGVITDINTSVAGKQDALTAGTNISINSANTISANGYVYDSTNGSLANIYRQDSDDGGALVANVASGLSSVAEGYNTVASGDYGSHAEGTETQANGAASHAEGNQTVATGIGSHAEGSKSIASGKNSHAEGGTLKKQNPTTAAGNQSHAEGASTLASGQSSHAEGEVTEAKNGVEHAQGNCNVSHKNSDTYGDAGNTIDSIGIGYVLNNVPQRKNATEVMQNGDQYIIGVGGYEGTDTKVQNASIKTVQEVINGKADAYEVATTADIEALFTLPSFYVDNTLFETYGNLTWVQWLDSRYNTSGFTHIYTASTYDSSVEQIPEVVSSAYPTAGGHYYSTCNDTYVPPTPTGPADDEIWYTTESGELWEPYDEYNGGDTLQIDGNTLISNTYENGHGVLRYANDITELNDYWGASDGAHTTDITSITFPHSITYIGNIMSYGNSDLNTINYNGTVAECSEIDMSYFMIYSDFSAREIVCTDGVYNPFGESEY